MGPSVESESNISPELAELVHEVADLVVNGNGYADDPAVTEARWVRRDALESAISGVVSLGIAVEDAAKVEVSR